MIEQSSERFGTLIVGAGHGGVQVAAALRSAEYSRGIACLSDEDVAPYDRPTLSKGYMDEQQEIGDFPLRSPDFWETPGLSLFLRTRVVAVFPEQHYAETEDGRRFEYENLVWAAGGEARRLSIPGAELSGVHIVRRFHDAHRLRAEAEAAKTAVIIGGGYIGLETAAALTKLGLAVTVVEVAEKLLGRVTSPVVADYFVATHEAAGVEFRIGVGVDEILGDGGRARGVRLSTGETLAADVVVVGVGLIPNIDALAVAGANTSNGIDIDEHCRTSLEDIFAIGDCVNFPIPLYEGKRVRLESVQNAADQGKTVAATILGDVEPYAPVPWFWSHQYSEKLQTVGLLTGYDEAVVRGSIADHRFSVVYLKDGQVLAVDAVNLVKDFAHAKSVVGKRYGGSLDQLADVSNGLKDLLRESAPVTT